MAISVLDRLKEYQKLNPSGNSIIPTAYKKRYFPLKKTRIPSSSPFGLNGVPEKYVGKTSAFVE